MLSSNLAIRHLPSHVLDLFLYLRVEGKGRNRGRMEQRKRKEKEGTKEGEERKDWRKEGEERKVGRMDRLIDGPEFLSDYSANKMLPLSEGEWGEYRNITNIVFLKLSFSFVRHFWRHSLNFTSKDFFPQNLSEIYTHYLLSQPDVSIIVILKMRKKER